MENSVKRTTPKIIIVLTIVSLLSLIVLGFYSMYGNTFIFNRFESYIFPFLTIFNIITT